MQKYPSDVSISKICIHANLEMIERQYPDNFPRFPPQECCLWTIPEIALDSDGMVYVELVVPLSYYIGLYIIVVRNFIMRTSE